MGQLWEGRKISVGYVNWELTKLLELDDHQMKKIESIDSVYDGQMSRLYANASYEREFKKKKIDCLLVERSKEIMKVLNEKQQKILYSYCTGLISFNKMAD